MATPPTFIQEAETVWNTSTTPKTTAGFDVQAGDVLVAFAMIGDPISITISNSGVALTWTQKQVISFTSFAYVSIWTTTVDTNRTGMTVSFARAATVALFGGNVLTWRGSDGVGASNQAHTSGAPSLSLTTTGDNSAIVIASGDWAAVDGTTRTWRTVNGSPATEDTYFRDSTAYTVYGGHNLDAGANGAKTVGLSAPAGQTYSIAAVEIFGTTPAAVPPSLVMAPPIPA